MQAPSVDTRADPHDAIIAQLRNLAQDQSGAKPATADPAAPSPQPSEELRVSVAPSNDNVGDFGDVFAPPPRWRLGRIAARVSLVVCAGAAATVWHAYGEQGTQKVFNLVPQLYASLPLPSWRTNAADAAHQPRPEQPAVAAQEPPSPASAAPPSGETAPVQTAAAEPAASAQPAAAAAAPETPVPQTQAALPPDVAQSIDAMKREIASLKQTVEQLQAGQQQLSRDIAKAAEQEARRKRAAQAAKPAPTSARPAAIAAAPAAPARPAPYPASQPQTYPQPQTSLRGPSYAPDMSQREAYIPPPASQQLPPQPGDSAVPRPPLPLQ